MAPRLVRRVLRFALACLLLTALAAGAGAYALHRIILTLPPIDHLQDFRPSTAVQVFDHEGNTFDQFYVERRYWVPLSELPEHVSQAFIASEDRRFWDHTGFDAGGILRALVANFRAGRTVQGGSTLTQQLVKNLLVGGERSYTRKLKEALLARRLERLIGKQRILELYLNFVPLGSGNYGVEAAARDYFGVSARDLDLGQAALLAGLVPAPSRYSPWNDPQAARRRREIALRSMVREGVLTDAQAMRFVDDRVVVPRVNPRPQAAAAYATEVRREVRRLFGERVPYELGLKVYAAMEPTPQRTAERAIDDALQAHRKRQGGRLLAHNLQADGSKGFLARAAGLERQEDGSLRPPTVGECLPASIGGGGMSARAGSFTWVLRPQDRASLVTTGIEDEAPRPLRDGDVVGVCVVSSDTVRLDDAPWAQGAAVAIENATGRVVAVVGGRSTALEGFVRATQARRQPGSSFKPYVYGAALLAGHHQTETVVDGPLSLPGANGKAWQPKNYGGGYAGPLPMREAMARSLNTVAVRLVLEQGAESVVRLARALGVRSPLRPDPTIALGSSEVTPLDQALGYAAIARLGVPTEPVWIERIEDSDGRTLGVAGGPVTGHGLAVARLPGGAAPAAMPPGVAAELTDLMSEVVRSGTARKAWRADIDRAGKTGTTNGFVDAWFVGFSPDWTIAVWVGTDGTGSLGAGETGGRAALPAWIRILDALPVRQSRFPVPPEATVLPWRGQQVVFDRAHAPTSLLPLAPAGPGPLPPFPGQEP